MAERLSDIEQRIDSIHQLSSVVAAIRGIAAARLREADAQLTGIRSYAETIGEAIGQALPLLAGRAGPVSQTGGKGTGLVIALCSEQGFVGGFNSRVLDAARHLVASGQASSCEMFVVGDRGVIVAGERGLQVDWSIPMATGAEQVSDLANQLAEALYQRLGAGTMETATIVHAVPDQEGAKIVTKALIPFDFSRFPHAAPTAAPLINLPAEALVAQLAEEYVFAELCEAAMLSYAAENEARMWAMLAAHGNVGRRLDELTAKARHMRQEEITAEVVELAAGVDAETAAGI
ncbi:MAG: F0F1 ATP synthase subunit gamma [Novosphingobium sp.]|nr:F0F1 ATP synthase subunit gamma [Novosphingobium sp.]